MEQDFNEVFLTRIERVRTVLGVSIREWAETLGVSASDFVRFNMKRECPPVRSMELLAGRLGIGLDSLLSGSFDLKTVTEHFRGNKAYIPHKYTVAAKSRIRTLAHSIDYLTKTFNPHFRKALLNHLQIDEVILLSRDQPSNVKLVVDMFDVLRRCNISDAHIMNLGAASAQQFKQILRPKFLNIQTAESLWAYVIEDVPSLFSGNDDHRLKRINKYGCIVSSVLNKEVAETLRPLETGSIDTCSLRTAISTFLSTYIDLPKSFVKKTACIHQGDSECRWEIVFPSKRTENVFPLR